MKKLIFILAVVLVCFLLYQRGLNTPVTPLVKAVYTGEEKAVRYHLANGADPNQTDRNKTPLIILAVQHRQPAILELLLEADANVNQMDADRSTALMWSIENSDAVLAQTLLRHGADANTVNNNHLTALMIAATKGYPILVKKLLRRTRNIDARNKNGSTALMIATALGHYKIMSLLLGAGADINALDNHHHTPLIRAVYQNDVQSVLLLVGAGADKQITDQDGDTPLAIAKSKGYNEIIRILEGRSNEKADLSGAKPAFPRRRAPATKQPQQVPPQAPSALFSNDDEKEKEKDAIAGIKTQSPAQGGRREPDLGKNKNKLDKLLFSAVWYDMPEDIKKFIDDGADVNSFHLDQRDLMRKTPLMAAENATAARLLLQAKADVRLKNERGRTALMEACRNGRLDVVEELLQYDDKINETTPDKMTALTFAKQSKNQELVNFLIKHGAKDFFMQSLSGSLNRETEK